MRHDFAQDGPERALAERAVIGDGQMMPATRLVVRRR